MKCFVIFILGVCFFASLGCKSSSSSAATGLNPSDEYLDDILRVSLIEYYRRTGATPSDAIGIEDELAFYGISFDSKLYQSLSFRLNQVGDDWEEVLTYQSPSGLLRTIEVPHELLREQRVQMKILNGVKITLPDT